MATSFFRFCRLINLHQWISKSSSFALGLVVLWLFCVTAAQGQDEVFKHYGNAEGFLGVEINDMKFDANGTMFLATGRGLWTFDGQFFEQIPFTETKQWFISSLHFDRSGKLWCQNFANQVFYLEDKRLNLFPLDGLFSIKDDFTTFLDVKDSLLYLGFNDSLYAIHVDKASLQESWSIKKYQRFVYSFYVKPNGNIILPALPQGHIEFVKSTKRDYIVNSDLPNHIRLIGYGTQYIGADLKRGSVIHFNEQFKRIKEWKIVPDGHDVYLAKLIGKDLWILTSDGAKLFDLKTGKVVKHLFASKQITNIVEDPVGGLWFSTLENGLFHWQSKGLLSSISLLQESSILKLAKSDKHFFALTANGSVLSLNEDFSIKKNLFVTKRKDILSVSPEGNIIWTGSHMTQNGGKTLLGINGPKDIVNLPDNRLLYATSTGTSLLREEKLSNEIDDGILLSNVRGLALAVCENEMLVADILGLHVFDLVTARFKYDISYNNKVLIATSMIAKDGAVWIGTLDKGLLRYQNGNITSQWFIDKGFPDEQINKLHLEDSLLWIVSARTISVLNTNNQKFIQTNIDWFPSVFTSISKGDSLIFSTEEGLFLLKNPFNSEQKIFRKIILNLQYEGKLNPLNNIIPIDAVSPKIGFIYNAWNTKKNEYLAYKISTKGDADHWIRLTPSSREIDLSQLPPGRFMIEVVIMDSNDSILVRSNSLSFIKENYWYQNDLFKLVAFFFLMLCFVGAVVYYLQRKNQRVLDQHALLQSKITAIKAQLNPHFLYNILNSLQAFIVTERNDKAEKVVVNLGYMMRKVLDFSEKQTISLHDEIDLLQKYLELEKIRLDDTFTYSFTHDCEDYDFEIPALLILPFVENAIKHGLRFKEGDKLLNISIKQIQIPDADMIQIAIEDNGIGRAASIERNQVKNEGTAGFSTKANQSRVDLINQIKRDQINLNIEDKIDKDGQPCGTLVRIQIKV
jgi:ligand-binding sensor domain-containing protein